MSARCSSGTSLTFAMEVRGKCFPRAVTRRIGRTICIYYLFKFYTRATSRIRRGSVGSWQSSKAEKACLNDFPN